MGYVKWSYDTLNQFCTDVFKAFGFNDEESAEIKGCASDSRSLWY